MDQFVTWEMLGDFVKLASIVLAVTQFLKNLPFIKKLPTQYLSWLVAFILITVTHLSTNDFTGVDLILYAISAIFVGTSASGIYDAGDAGVDKVSELAGKVKTYLNNEEVEGVGGVDEESDK